MSSSWSNVSCTFIFRHYLIISLSLLMDFQVKMSPHNRFKRDVSKFTTPTYPMTTDNQSTKASKLKTPTYPITTANQSTKPTYPMTTDIQSTRASLQTRSAQSAQPAVTRLISKYKYGHVQSKVNTFWSQQEIDKAGVKGFFERKGTSSASSSACSSAAASPNTSVGSVGKKTVCLASLRQMQQLSGDDFAARISEIKSGIKEFSSSTRISGIKSGASEIQSKVSEFKSGVKGLSSSTRNIKSSYAEGKENYTNN